MRTGLLPRTPLDRTVEGVASAPDAVVEVRAANVACRLDNASVPDARKEDVRFAKRIRPSVTRSRPLVTRSRPLVTRSRPLVTHYSVLYK